MNVFVDTNVIVYAEDPREPTKSLAARELLRTLRSRHGPVVSSQVVSETANTLLRLSSDPDFVARAVDLLEEVVTVLPITPSVVRMAIDGVARFGFSFYDAQIWAAAKVWGATVVLSEDFSDGLVADGVRFANPFAPDFDLGASLG